ncbi:MAG: threonine aldolase [Verrucomicrobiales bacterium]|jgi:threonine aldolase|nr:threonine aldolase [Verrucomicrobiales bacterium]|tara:strand:+ start:6320 stop:7336 length:1017 start_codon:yes stop_codon:yes gene_type:complete
MQIDFRSDTVTRPCPAMLEAMPAAEVGDAVFGDDPTVLELESFAAHLFGMEGALFCPSGTMSNQIAIKSHTRPGDQMICDETAHVYVYEGGGAALHSGISCKLMHGDGGRFSAKDVAAAINPDDPHYPRTRLVSIENTCNKGGGTIWDFDEIRHISSICLEHDLRLHLDGARVFNAIVETAETPRDFGEVFDSISVCLSKGLGAPVGSLLLGGADFIKEANRMRKAFGGGMRQAGYLAAAGLFALKNNIERLADDHCNAERLSEALAVSSLSGNTLTPETNLVMFDFETPEALTSAMERLSSEDILTVAMGPRRMRLVTHKDITDEMMDRALEIIGNL